MRLGLEYFLVRSMAMVLRVGALGLTFLLYRAEIGHVHLLFEGILVVGLTSRRT